MLKVCISAFNLQYMAFAKVFKRAHWSIYIQTNCVGNVENAIKNKVKQEESQTFRPKIMRKVYRSIAFLIDHKLLLQLFKFWDLLDMCKTFTTFCRFLKSNYPLETKVFSYPWRESTGDSEKFILTLAFRLLVTLWESNRLVMRSFIRGVKYEINMRLIP